MKVLLYINGKKIRFFVEFGWFSGEDFWLVGFGLFSKPQGIDTIYLLDMRFLKLHLLIGLDYGNGGVRDD